MRTNAACGHTEYDKGHCGQPDCANYFRRCNECYPHEHITFPRERREQLACEGKENPGWLP